MHTAGCVQCWCEQGQVCLHSEESWTHPAQYGAHIQVRVCVCSMAHAAVIVSSDSLCMCTVLLAKQGGALHPWIFH